LPGTWFTRSAAETGSGIDVDTKGIDENPETSAQRRGRSGAIL